MDFGFKKQLQFFVHVLVRIAGQWRAAVAGRVITNLLRAVQ